MALHDCDGPFAEFRMIGIIKASNLTVNFCQKQIYLSGMKAWRKIFQFGHGRFQISIFLHLAGSIKNCLRTHLLHHWRNRLIEVSNMFDKIYSGFQVPILFFIIFLHDLPLYSKCQSST